MRNKFSELIEQKVAEFHYTPIAPEIPSQDLMCRNYNNLFSMVSSTHMNRLEDGTYVITGSMIKDQPRWNAFIQSNHWGAVNFSTAKSWSVESYLYDAGFTGVYSELNGDTVYLLVPFEQETFEPATMPASYVTTESKIPHPIREISVTGDVNKIRECFKESATQTVKNLNESLYIKGDNWIATHGYIKGCVDDKVYILKV